MTTLFERTYGVRLAAQHHDYGSGKACINDFASLLCKCDGCQKRRKTGILQTDKLTCACPVLQRFSMALNDARWRDDVTRTIHMGPLVWKIPMSKATREIEQQRAEYAARQVSVRIVAPLYLSLGYEPEAGVIATAAVLGGLESLRDAAHAARAAADAAHAARAAADAVYAADAAANAAYAAAAATAGAAAKAAAGAAAKAAGAAANAATRYLVEACAIFSEMADIGVEKPARVLTIEEVAEHLADETLTGVSAATP